MNRANVELHIEELVLHGFPAGERYRIADALQQELARLLGEPGIAPKLTKVGEVPRLDGGTFEVAPDSGPETVAVRAARAVARSIIG